MIRFWLAGLGACLALAGCGKDPAGRDQATVDRGAFRPPQPAPQQSPITVGDSTRVNATPAVAALSEYLASPAPAGRAFDLAFVSFVKGSELREDPNGSFASLAAVLREHPGARARVEVAIPNPEEPGPAPAADARAAKVAGELVRNGVPAGQVSSQGARAQSDKLPYVRLVITQK